MRLAVLLATVCWLTVVSHGQSWTIGNSRIERTITYSPVRGLHTSRFTSLDTHVDLISAADTPPSYAAEFSLTCNGHALNGSGKSFRLSGATTRSLPSGKQLSVILQAADLPLQAEVLYRVYDGQPAIRKSLILRNMGVYPLHISHLAIESIAPTLGPLNELLLDAQYGSSPHEILYTGRSEDVSLQVFSARTGDGLAVLNEVPGYLKRTEVDGFYHPGHVLIKAMYDTDLMPFTRTIEPGGFFATAAVSTVSFRRNDGQFDPHWVLPSYAQAVLQRRIGPSGSPWIYNTWNPFKRTIDATTTMQLIDAAGAMKMDIFTIDDGWQKRYGENAVNLSAFPQGLDPIRRAVEDHGMKLGLWLPLATIDEDTEDYRRHPEWVALDAAGRPKVTDTAAGKKIVMCMASPYRDRAAARILEAVDRYNLAYVKLDLTTVFNAYGEAPGCWPKDRSYDGWSESLGRIYEAIRYVTTKVYEKHPEVLIDLTFELWGQKHLIDAGLLAAGDLDWLSNVDDSQIDSAGPRQARGLLYRRGASMPADAMLIGNLQANLPDRAEVFATELGSAPVLLGDLRLLSPDDLAWYRDHIEWYKLVRSKLNLSESFFPLGHWQQPSVVDWDGFARLSRSGSGLVALFRNESQITSAPMKLPLIPKGRYRVTSAMTHRELGVFADSAFLQGIDVPFEGAQKVEVLEIEAVPQ